ncbi:MAG: metalloproteinase [Candidatus Scalindua brodae]|uniref:Metalloproteinase n=1 Tax=Candidatus Scalindua brodae TaxID=237368 RepID=A0A0B0EQ39_9BACT|nr:MAG: metalloproteinase [Candidatus Scalindua brodae]
MIKLLYFRKKILFLFILVVGFTAISKPGLAYVIHDDGWDGPGQNSWSMSYYFGTMTPDLAPVDVKSTLVSALSVWSSVVDITFTETISANQNNAIDFSFVTGNHGDGYPLNPGGALAHGFFPAPPNPETIGGDVHFNDNYLWEIGNSLGALPLILNGLRSMK